MPPTVSPSTSRRRQTGRVDNGSSPDHDSYQADNRKAFSGKVLAIVQSTKEAGEITVTAKADGLQSSTVKIATTAVPGTSTEKTVRSFYYSRNYYVRPATSDSAE